MTPSAHDCFAFDLNGFIRIPEPCHHRRLLPPMLQSTPSPAISGDVWYGPIHREDIDEGRGVALQQVYELPAFRSWIDHPSWIHHVRHFIGGHDTFDSHYGDVFIDENFVSLRARMKRSASTLVAIRPASEPVIGSMSAASCACRSMCSSRSQTSAPVMAPQWWYRLATKRTFHIQSMIVTGCTMMALAAKVHLVLKRCISQLAMPFSSATQFCMVQPSGSMTASAVLQSFDIALHSATSDSDIDRVQNYWTTSARSSATS